MGFLTVLPYAPDNAPLPNTDVVAAVAGSHVSGYRLPVRAGFSTERPRALRKAAILNDNVGLADGEIRRGMLHDSLV